MSIFPPAARLLFGRRRAPSLTCAVLALCLALPWLAGCGLHNGGDALAFLRNGQLWTIQPDGSNALMLLSGNVIAFAWSPDHHQLALRLAAPHTPVPPATSTLGAPQAAGVIAAESINGGVGLQLSPNSSILVHGDPWWNANGNRLVYAERLPGAPHDTYVVSQSDQPAGIARKPLADDASIPAISADGSQVAVIDDAGNVRVGAPGVSGTVVASGALLVLPNTNRPARVLWQPHTSALLYATTAPTGVRLALRSPAGSTRTIATTAAALDYAFSPDGSRLLVRTPQSFELWSAAGGSAPTAMWPNPHPLALPWWAPDGRALLIQDDEGLTLVDPASGAVKRLLAFATPPYYQLPYVPTWHPAASSPWSPDGSHVVFVSVAGDEWQGRALPQPKGSATGLYVAAVSASGGGQPALIDSGDDRAPGWSTLDPSTAFLVAA